MARNAAMFPLFHARPDLQIILQAFNLSLTQPFWRPPGICSAPMEWELVRVGMDARTLPYSRPPLLSPPPPLPPPPPPLYRERTMREETAAPAPEVDQHLQKAAVPMEVQRRPTPLPDVPLADPVLRWLEDEPDPAMDTETRRGRVRRLQSEYATVWQRHSLDGTFPPSPEVRSAYREMGFLVLDM